MLPNVTEVEVSKEKQSATITMEKHIALSTFQNALDKKYSITAAEHNETAQQAKSWFATYKPILIIFAYITTISNNHHFNYCRNTTQYISLDASHEYFYGRFLSYFFLL